MTSCFEDVKPLHEQAARDWSGFVSRGVEHFLDSNTTSHYSSWSMFGISCCISEFSSLYLQLQSAGQENSVAAILRSELVIQDQIQSALSTKRPGSLVWQVDHLRDCIFTIFFVSCWYTYTYTMLYDSTEHTYIHTYITYPWHQDIYTLCTYMYILCVCMSWISGYNSTWAAPPCCPAWGLAPRPRPACGSRAMCPARGKPRGEATSFL